MMAEGLLRKDSKRGIWAISEAERAVWLNTVRIGNP